MTTQLKNIKSNITLIFIGLVMMLMPGCMTLAMKIAPDESGLAGYNASIKEDYYTAAMQYERAYNRMEQAGNRKGMAINAVNIADCYTSLHDYAKAKEWAVIAKDLAESENYDIV